MLGDAQKRRNWREECWHGDVCRQLIPANLNCVLSVAIVNHNIYFLTNLNMKIQKL